MKNGGSIPRVARPPTLTTPKRANGRENVVILGVMSRMTITSDGFGGLRAGMIAVVQVFGSGYGVVSHFCHAIREVQRCF